MKKTLLSLALLVLPLTLAAQSKYQSAVAQCFRDYFAGRQPDLSALDKTLKPSQVEAAQQMVWQCWQSAMPNTFQPMTTLDEATAGHYDIPDSLEPNARMNYYLGTKGTQPTNGYPLFIYLHGSGPRDQEWPTGLKINKMNPEVNSLCFIPQIPNEGPWYRWWQRSKQHVWERFIRQMMATPNVDPDKVYFWGISEGGYGGQRLASFYADYLAGAGPIACGEPLINAPVENCANIAFSITTGEKDFAWARYQFTSITGERFDELQAQHPDLYLHRTVLVPERGHFVDYYSTTPWLQQYTRNPYPRYVCWEDYAMDGRHRDAFYNLVPLTSIDAESRRTYEMSITGQTIQLNASDVEYQPTEMSEQWRIPLRYSKTLTPQAHGSLRICLCDSLLRIDKKVDVVVNGRQVAHVRPRLTLREIVENCIRFYDPRRLYPTSVVVEW